MHCPHLHLCKVRVLHYHSALGAFYTHALHWCKWPHKVQGNGKLDLFSIEVGLSSPSIEAMAALFKPVVLSLAASSYLLKCTKDQSLFLLQNLTCRCRAAMKTNAAFLAALASLYPACPHRTDQGRLLWSLLITQHITVWENRIGGWGNGATCLMFQSN